MNRNVITVCEQDYVQLVRDDIARVLDEKGYSSYIIYHRDGDGVKISGAFLKASQLEEAVRDGAYILGKVAEDIGLMEEK